MLNKAPDFPHITQQISTNYSIEDSWTLQQFFLGKSPFLQFLLSAKLFRATIYIHGRECLVLQHNYETWAYVHLKDLTRIHNLRRVLGEPFVIL